MFEKKFERNIEVENTLKKLNSSEDVHGGIVWTTVTTSSATCGGIIIAVSAAQCPTLACSSRCGTRG